MPTILHSTEPIRFHPVQFFRLVSSSWFFSYVFRAQAHKIVFWSAFCREKCAAQDRKEQSRVLGILQVTHLMTNPIRVEVEFWQTKQVALIIEVICIVLVVAGYGFRDFSVFCIGLDFLVPHSASAFGNVWSMGLCGLNHFQFAQAIDGSLWVESFPIRASILSQFHKNRTKK